MDINYLLAREQESLLRAAESPSRSARAVHRGFAKAYGLLLQASKFPHDRIMTVAEPLRPALIPTEAIPAAAAHSKNEHGQATPEVSRSS